MVCKKILQMWNSAGDNKAAVSIAASNGLDFPKPFEICHVFGLILACHIEITLNAAIPAKAYAEYNIIMYLQH
jgi:hypothetical protein